MTTQDIVTDVTTKLEEAMETVKEVASGAMDALADMVGLSDADTSEEVGETDLDTDEDDEEAGISDDDADEADEETASA
jgi:hypothetical protein